MDVIEIIRRVRRESSWKLIESLYNSCSSVNDIELIRMDIERLIYRNLGIRTIRYYRSDTNEYKATDISLYLKQAARGIEKFDGQCQAIRKDGVYYTSAEPLSGEFTAFGLDSGSQRVVQYMDTSQYTNVIAESCHYINDFIVMNLKSFRKRFILVASTYGIRQNRAEFISTYYTKKFETELLRITVSSNKKAAENMFDPIVFEFGVSEHPLKFLKEIACDVLSSDGFSDPLYREISSCLIVSIYESMVQEVVFYARMLLLRKLNEHGLREIIISFVTRNSSLNLKLDSARLNKKNFM